MRSVGVEVLQPALDGALAGLLLAPGGDLTHDVHADVRGACDALLLAHHLVVRPCLVIDSDHATGLPLRRHVHSVADRALTRHPRRVTRMSIDLSLTGHP